ncbi:MAG: trypsin-like peptidase domain-containing protein, partial [Candidatus Brocadiales bacterium]
MSLEGEWSDDPSPETNKEVFSKDYVAVLDADGNVVDRLTGTGDWWAISVEGDTAVIELHANGENNGYGFDIDQYGWGFAGPMGLEEPKKICGNNDLESICDASVAATRKAAAKPVARLLFQSGASWYYGTGWLFNSKGYMMSNAHNIGDDTEAASAEALFEYQCAKAGDKYECISLVQRNCDLDFEVLKIKDSTKGNPATKYGSMTISTAVPAVGDTIWIPQHPGGRKKEVSEGAVKAINVDVSDCNIAVTGANNGLTYYADTEGGSSGSPVLNSSNKVIGIHHAGSCTTSVPPAGSNSGILMKNIQPLLKTSTIDLIFCFDLTGSMWDDIAAVQSAATSIVNSVFDKGPNSRIALVSYKDCPDGSCGGASDYTYLVHRGWSRDSAAIIAAINALSTGGGADTPESVYAALKKAIAVTGLDGAGLDKDWRCGVTKAIIVMGDAPPQDPDCCTGDTLATVVAAAAAVDPVVVFPVVVGGNTAAATAFDDLASETGGTSFAAATASDVVDALTDAIDAASEETEPKADLIGDYDGSWAY